MIQTSISNMLSLKESIDTTSLDRIFTSETRLANISQKLGEVNYLLDKSSEGLKSIALLIKDKVSNIFDRDTQNLLALKKLIHAHDPMRVVERGYSLTLNDKGKVISSIDDIENNENITTRLSDGEIISTVKEKKENK